MADYELDMPYSDSQGCAVSCSVHSVVIVFNPNQQIAGSVGVGAVIHQHGGSMLEVIGMNMDYPVTTITP